MEELDTKVGYDKKTVISFRGQNIKCYADDAAGNTDYKKKDFFLLYKLKFISIK